MNKFISIRKEVFNVLEEFVKDAIPFAGTLLSLGELQASLSDKIFKAKIDGFINGLPEIEKDKRDKFIHEISENIYLKRKVCEVVVLAIDQLSDFDKVEILSKVFTAYIREEISLELLKKLYAAINSAFSDDLKRFAYGHNNNLAVNQALVHTGLTVVVKDRTVIYRSGGKVEKSGVEFVVSGVGRAFQKVMNTPE